MQLKTLFKRQILSTARRQLAKVVSSSTPGPPRVPEPVYSATDKHSASYAVKCQHKITASLDLLPVSRARSHYLTRYTYSMYLPRTEIKFINNNNAWYQPKENREG